MEELKFSVLMSVYQGEKAKYLRQSLESIKAQSAQPDELVIVEDGPLPPELLKALDEAEGMFPAVRRVRLEENRGLGIALAAGLERCSHPLVARMDSDDVAAPDRFALQLEAFRREPVLAVLGGQIAEFSTDPASPDGERRVPLENADIHAYVKKRCPMNHMTVMFQKDAVQAAGGYQPFTLFEDYDLWARMCARGAYMRNLPDILVFARTGNGMLKRRGGLFYAKQQRAFQRRLRRLGLITPWRCWVNCLIRTAVSLMPQRLRGWVYRHVLRRK